MRETLESDREGARASGQRQVGNLPELRQYVEERLKEFDEEFVPGETRIPLSAPTFGVEEILESIDSLLRRRVTMGAKVRAFEDAFRRYCEVNGATCVNSGSSANLLSLAILTNPQVDRPMLPGREVLVPAVSWSTTVFPIIDVGLIPVLVDVDLDTLNMDPSGMESAPSNLTGAIMPVHLLGNPADMAAVMDLARAHDLYVVEDACEAHGATLDGRKVGSIGDLATFSFYFSHHISTIEGGMLVSDNDEYLELARAMRAHGYIRDLRNASDIAKRYPEIDSRFLFLNRGFNFRPTEIQGAFGIHQIEKLDSFVRQRRENAEYVRKRLAEHSSLLRPQTTLPGARNVYLGFSLLVDPGAPFSRTDLVQHLEARGIETRPIVAGNLAEQPALQMFPHRVHGDLRNARHVMRAGLYFGTHHGIGPRQRDYIIDQICEFVRSNCRGT